MKVFLVDNEPARRTGMEQVLSGCDLITVTGTLGDSRALPKRIASLDAEVVLIASGDGYERDLRLVRDTALLSRSHRLLLIQNLSSHHQAEQLLAVGGYGSVAPDASPPTLIGAVLVAGAGGIVFVPSALRKDPNDHDGDQVKTEPSPDEARLTERECDVLALLALGRSNKEIAEGLVLSETTVKKYVSEAMRKTRQPDRLNAGLYARRHGLVPRM
jgi:DNA-binding NarL/FixJ family response regulator